MKQLDSTRAHAAVFGRGCVALALALGALMLSACGGGGDDAVVASPAPPPVTAPAAAAIASATIGAAGGTLIGPDDVRVEVPAGALTAPTTLTITRTSARAPALPASAAAVTSAPTMYEFTPHGLQFAAPVTISMPSTLDPAVDAVLMAQPDEAWVKVAATVASGRVSWATTHFSWSYPYTCAATYPPGTPLPPNGPDCEFPSARAVVTATPAAAMSTTRTDQYAVVAEADVNVRFSYTAPLNCINPTIRTARVPWPQNTNPTALPTTTVALTRTPVTGVPGAFQLTGSTDINFHFAYADNGRQVASFYFACQGGLLAGGGLLFDVGVPQPPAAPAAPTIVQQPANASVLNGTTASYDVLATAPDNLSIRWERRSPGGTAFSAASGAAPITGGSRLGVAAVFADSGATYRAQVCNSLRGVDNCIYSSLATLTVTPPPPPAGTLAAPSRLSGAFTSSCGLAAAGGVLCWGANTAGELGRGSTLPAEGTPAPATGLTSVTSVGSSNYVSCAVHGGGRISCWGGYAGVRQFEHSAVPVEIAGVTDARRVRVANSFFCTIDGDRRIRCNDITGPLQIDGQVVEDAIDVAFVSSGRCVLLGSGEARCADYVGLDLVTTRVVPMVRSLGNVPGYTFTPFCVVLQSGVVRCWGTNTNGQLGTGNADLSVNDAVIPGIGPALQVAIGYRHACALAADGTVSCWGTGYMGNGAGVELARAPQAVSGLAGIVEISAGFDTTCALRSDGAVLCWGDNSAGSVGIGTLGAAVLVPTPTLAGAVFAH